MGLTRKLSSVATAGAIDFRSDKERTASAAASTARSAKKQTRLLEKQNKLIADGAGTPVAAAAVAAPPTLASQIADLGALRDQGILTDSEFEAAKTRLISG